MHHHIHTWQNNDVKTKTATAKTKAKTSGTNKVTPTSGREAPLDQEAKKSRGLAYNTVTTMRYRCDCEETVDVSSELRSAVRTGMPGHARRAYR